MSEINWDSPEIAASYDRNCDHQFMKGQMLVQMMGIAEGDYVLDLGCGTGKLAREIIDSIGRSGYLMGIDPSSYRLAIAKKRFESIPHPNVKFHLGQAESLPESNNSFFNHVIFCSSFHWVDDKKAALAEVYRVLKPGGSIGMTTLNREGSFLFHDCIRAVLKQYGLPECSNHEGMKRVTADELQSLLEDAGFTDISIDLKMIPSDHHFPKDILHWKEKGRYSELICSLSDARKIEITEAVMREYEAKKAVYGDQTGPGTLFARARKE